MSLSAQVRWQVPDTASRDQIKVMIPEVGLFVKVLAGVGSLYQAKKAGQGPDVWSVDPGSLGAVVLIAQNKDVVDMAAGQPVAVHSSGSGIVLASSSPGNTAIGLTQTPIAVSFSGPVQTSGVLSLTDWTAATGAGSLNPRGQYFAGAAGQLALTPPNTGGSVVQPVGVEVGPQSLSLQNGMNVLL